MHSIPLQSKSRVLVVFLSRTLNSLQCLPGILCFLLSVACIVPVAVVIGGVLKLVFRQAIKWCSIVFVCVISVLIFCLNDTAILLKSSYCNTLCTGISVLKVELLCLQYVHIFYLSSLPLWTATE